MDIKKYIAALGFVPKDGTNGIYHKTYVDYTIEIDFEKQSVNYGDGIIAESRTTQNFSQLENFVVLECVDRLLSKDINLRILFLKRLGLQDMAHLGDWTFVLIVKMALRICLLSVKLMVRSIIRSWLKSIKMGGNYLLISNYQVARLMW